MNADDLPRSTGEESLRSGAGLDVAGEPGYDHTRVNYIRRATGIAICFGPVVLLSVSLFYGTGGWTGEFVGLGCTVLGLLIGLLNVHLSFVRPRLYFWRHRSLEGYQFVSGIPVVGTFFVVIGGILGFRELPTAAIGLITLILDTGGSPWFLIMTWRDRSMWDA